MMVHEFDQTSTPSPILVVKDLAVSFATPAGRVYALRGVDISLQTGETLALVGESGSGKSVTSRAIMGLLSRNARLDSGSIHYDGRDLLTLPESALCRLRGRRIAMIFQDPMSSLDPIMRVGKQLTEAMEGISPVAAKNRALKLLEEVGIPDPQYCYRQYPFELSGGMRQRVVIAIALSADPDILICDEPTTALDVTIQAQILDLINRLKIQRQLSVLFITHDLGVVAHMADRIAVMYAGKIVEQGTAEDIFYHPAHPYTWALLASTPHPQTTGRLTSIPGSPPLLTALPRGDAFAPRNPYAMAIDYEEEPPLFRISDTHFAATWLLHPNAPAVTPPEGVIRLMTNGDTQQKGDIHDP